MNTLEIVLFANEAAARRAGFRRLGGTHPQSDFIVAWWPSRHVRDLHAMEFGRVTVTDEVRRHAHGRPREERELEEVLHVLRARLRMEPMIWMDL